MANYANYLKALRKQMLASSTGGVSEEVRSMESFIPSRMPVEEPKETTEDIITKGATWLSEIKKAAVEAKQNYEKLEAKKKPAETPISAMAKAAASTLQTQEAEERREAFIARRADSSPSTYAPERPGERRATAQGSAGPTPGYGEISQKQMENIIRSEAETRGIDPDVAVAIFYSEGASAYQSQIARSGGGTHNGKEASFGPYQLFTGGGLGSAYEKATGRKLINDNTLDGVTNQIRFALDAAVDQGWTPWHGRKTAGVGERDGLARAKRVGNWS